MKLVFVLLRNLETIAVSIDYYRLISKNIDYFRFPCWEPRWLNRHRDWTIRSSILSRNKKFVSLFRTCSPSLGPSQPPVQWPPGVPYRRVNRSR